MIAIYGIKTHYDWEECEIIENPEIKISKKYGKLLKTKTKNGWTNDFEVYESLEKFKKEQEII